MSRTTNQQIVPVPESLQEPLRRLRHDLRTPLNHIIGLSDLWVGETGDDTPHPELQKDLKHILAAAWKINDLSEQLMTEEGFAIPVPGASKPSP